MQQWHQECVGWSVFGDIEVSVGLDMALISFVSVSAATNQLLFGSPCFALFASSHVM